MRIASALVFVLILSSLAMSQIQITSSDVQAMYAPGKSWQMLENYAINTTMNVGVASSTAQSWNLPSVSFPDTLRMDNVLPSSTPYALQFRSATHAQRASFSDAGTTSTSYNFVRITADSLIELGSAYRMQGPGVDTSIIQVRSQLEVLFPLQLGRTMTRRDSIPIAPGSYIVNRTTEVCDAFGSLTLPRGTFPALRLKATTISETVYGGAPMRDTSTTLSWITKEGYTATADPADRHSSSGDILLRGVSYSYITTGPTGIADQNPIVPADAQLYQNYPNPFNPTTTIEYVITKDETVRLTVHNALGEEVATLVNGHQTSGHHRLMYDGNALPTGIYFYRLIAGGQVNVGKMSLIK